MAWDKGRPIEGGLAPDLNDVIILNNNALEAALDAYIRFETGGTQTGQPRQGSARVYFQDAAPTARLDGDYFDSTDFGCIWIDSNATIDNQFNILTAADGAGTETWTPISTEIIAVLLAAARVFASTLGVTGDFAVNTDKFTVDAETGNTVVGGSLDLASLVTTGGGFLDEDDMASDAADKVASQQSIKAYADAAPAAQMTPSSYGGEESITFPNGAIMKTGVTGNIGANSTTEVTYGTAFPTEVISAQVTIKAKLTTLTPMCAQPKSGSEKTILEITNSYSVALPAYWTVMGR